MSGTVESRTRVVVEGRWDGSIIPSKIEEMRREVFIRPGAVVSGAVFGHRVAIEGPSWVEKATYATDRIELKAVGRTVFRSSLGARRVIEASAADTRYFIAGDVVADQVRIRDAFVLGAVHGRTVDLSNSVVLGPVLADESIKLHNSLVHSAESQSVHIGQGCSLLFPYVSAGTIELADKIRITGLLDVEEYLYPEEVVRNGERSYLTCGARATDLASVEDRVAELKDFVLGELLAGGGRAIKTGESLGGSRIPEALRKMCELIPEGGADAI